MRGYPKRWICYDTETNSRPLPGKARGERLTFRLGFARIFDGFADDEEFTQDFPFYDVEHFHTLINNMPLTRDPIWIFAHNHGFDSRIVGFFRKLAAGTYTLMPPGNVPGKGRYKEPLFVADSPPFLVRLFRADGQQIMLSDSFQWTYHSLKWCGDALSLSKKPLPPDHATDDEVLSYCIRDVDILCNVMNSVWGLCYTLGVKDWQPTVASQAYFSYRMRYEHRRITRSDADDVMKFARHSYYGGRCDCFKIGRTEGPIYQVDVNAMYPYVMMQSLFPKAVEDYNLDPGTVTNGPPPAPHRTTAEVYLRTDDYPYPVRHKHGTWWCNGAVRTILSGAELRVACERGDVIRYGRYIRYDMGRLFYDCVKDWWGFRRKFKEGKNQLEEHIMKLLQNTLFGKFGQRTGKWIYHDSGLQSKLYATGKVVTDDPDEDIECRIIAGNTYYRNRQQESKTAFVPIAAFVTAYARVMMDMYRDRAGPENVLYQATDSLLVNEDGYDRLGEGGFIADNDIGMFKHEATYDWVDVRNINHLDKGPIKVRPGLKATAKPLGQDIWEVEEWEGAASGISRGNVSSVSVRKTLRQLDSTYRGGDMCRSGSVIPWTVSNWSLTPENQVKLALPLWLEEG